MALAAKLYFFVFCSQTSPKRFFDTLSLISHLYKFSTKKKKNEHLFLEWLQCTKYCSNVLHILAYLNPNSPPR